MLFDVWNTDLQFFGFFCFVFFFQKTCHVFEKWSYTDTFFIAPVGLGHLAACWQMNSISWKNKNTRLWQSCLLSFPMFLCFHRTKTTHVKLQPICQLIQPLFWFCLGTDVMRFRFSIKFENHCLDRAPWHWMYPPRRGAKTSFNLILLLHQWKSLATTQIVYAVFEYWVHLLGEHQTVYQKEKITLSSSASECYEDHGETYRGTLSITRSGIPCANWSLHINR